MKSYFLHTYLIGERMTETLSAAKATKAVPVISVILLYFLQKNAQGCQSGIHRIIDVGCLAVRKMQKKIVQTLKQRMTQARSKQCRIGPATVLWDHAHYLCQNES